MKGLVFVSEKTRVRLRIVGSEFVVSADEDRDYIVKISNMVDEQIKEILRQSDSMSVSMAAILAAINYCDELEKKSIIAEELLRRTETSESLASRACAELDQLRVENKQLREEKLGLHKVIESLQGAGAAEQKEEESPQQLRIPLPNDKNEAEKEELNKEEKAQEHRNVGGDDAALNEKAEAYEKADSAAVQTEKPQTQAAAPMTERQMLEEKRKALLNQRSKNATQNQNRPKPFRPVNSAKSGGGAFSGNAKGETKINYRDNDKISGSFRRNEFADAHGEDEMLSFFDQR